MKGRVEVNVALCMLHFLEVSLLSFLHFGLVLFMYTLLGMGFLEFLAVLVSIKRVTTF